MPLNPREQLRKDLPTEQHPMVVALAELEQTIADAPVHLIWQALLRGSLQRVKDIFAAEQEEKVRALAEGLTIRPVITNPAARRALQMQ